MNVKDKTVIITGGANGIGFSCAQQLLQCNIKAVAILDLQNQNSADAIAKLENQFGKSRVFFFPCNVTNDEETKSSFKDAVEALGGLDILINSAGILNHSVWEPMISVNFSGIVRMTLLGMQTMSKLEGGHGGTIVNIASTAGLTPVEYLPIYCGTKYAVVGFTLSLSKLYDKTGVRMLLSCPGFTKTSMTKMMFDEERLNFIDYDSREKSTRLKVWQTPEDVSQGILKLINEGENGMVCVIEGKKPPYVVKIPLFADLKFTTL